MQIHWPGVSRDRVRAVNHDRLAGLQIADAVATSAFYAVNKTQYGEVEDRYFKLIGKTVYRHQQSVLGYGLKFWCNDSDQEKRLAIMASPKI